MAKLTPYNKARIGIAFLFLVATLATGVAAVQDTAALAGHLFFVFCTAFLFVRALISYLRGSE